jgi:hypothetical protein
LADWSAGLVDCRGVSVFCGLDDGDDFVGLVGALGRFGDVFGCGTLRHAQGKLEGGRFGGWRWGESFGLGFGLDASCRFGLDASCRFGLDASCGFGCCFCGFGLFALFPLVVKLYVPE